MRRTALIVALAALVAGTSTLQAQSRRDRERERGIVEVDAASGRHGFYVSGTLGVGSERYKFSDEIEWRESLQKPTFALALGGTVASSFRLGGEVLAWGAQEAEYDDSFTAGLVVAEWYPIKSQGLYLTAGVGIARSLRDYVDPSVADGDERGIALMAGVGFELQLSRHIGVGPLATLYEGRFTRRDEPTLFDRVLFLGLQVTFQTH